MTFKFLLKFHLALRVFVRLEWSAPASPRPPPRPWEAFPVPRCRLPPFSLAIIFSSDFSLKRDFFKTEYILSYFLACTFYGTVKRSWELYFWIAEIFGWVHSGLVFWWLIITDFLGSDSLSGGSGLSLALSSSLMSSSAVVANCRKRPQRLNLNSQ